MGVFKRWSQKRNRTWRSYPFSPKLRCHQRRDTPLKKNKMPLILKGVLNFGDVNKVRGKCLSINAIWHFKLWPIERRWVKPVAAWHLYVSNCYPPDCDACWRTMCFSDIVAHTSTSALAFSIQDEMDKKPGKITLATGFVTSFSLVFRGTRLHYWGGFLHPGSALDQKPYSFNVLHTYKIAQWDVLPTAVRGRNGSSERWMKWPKVTQHWKEDSETPKPISFCLITLPYS